MSKGAAGDGELAGVESFVPDGEFEDGGEVGKEFRCPVGSFLGQVVVRKIRQNFQQFGPPFPHRGQHRFRRRVLVRLVSRLGAHAKAGIETFERDGTGGRNQRQEEIVGIGHVPHEPEGVVATGMNLMNPVPGSFEIGEQLLAQLSRVLKLALESLLKAHGRTS